MPTSNSAVRAFRAFTAVLPALPAWARQVNQSATYSRAYLEAAVELGVSRESVLAMAGVEATLVDDPAGRLSLQDIWKITAAALALTGDNCLGFAAGYRMPLTAHGNLGYALMCAATPREAIGILEQYWHLRGRGVRLLVSESEHELFLELAPELPPVNVLSETMLSSILTSMYRGLTFLVPNLPTSTEIWLRGAMPPGIDAWRNRLPALRFGMPRHGICQTGDLGLLDQPLPNANPEALAQALAQCARESALLEQGDDTVQQVRAALVLEQQGYPTPQVLADILHLTPRTLRRRLQEHGMNYQQLLEEARRRDSCRLLADSSLAIQQIAELLGYGDPANFTRAFRGWCGMTPRDWRLQQAAHAQTGA